MMQCTLFCSTTIYAPHSNRSELHVCMGLYSLPPQMITAEEPRSLHHHHHHQTEANGRARGGRAELIESQTLHSPLGSSFWCTVHGTCRVLCIYREISDSTNDMESPPMALKSPHAAQCVVLNAGGTAWRVPQEQTYRLSAAVQRIVIFKYSHI